MAKNWHIISLGGSLVCPKKPDFKFLKNFSKVILKWIKKGKRFILFIGGGKICREYQKTAKILGIKDSKTLDTIGISATFLNANLVRAIFGKIAYPSVLSCPLEKIKTEKKILVFGGFKPGWSTDFDAVLMAKNLKEKTVVNLSNIDFVYDKDPTKFKGAKPLKKISFSQLQKIVGKKWIAGGNFPLDPLATKLAKKEKIKVIVMNGKRTENFDNFLKGKKFLGTEIIP